MTNLSVIENVVNQENQHDDITDMAGRWGKEDATEGNDMRGSVYFSLNTPEYVSYNDGYQRGLIVRRLLDGESDENEFMLTALLTLKASKQASRPSQTGSSDRQRQNELHEQTVYGWAF